VTNRLQSPESLYPNPDRERFLVGSFPIRTRPDAAGGRYCRARPTWTRNPPRGVPMNRSSTPRLIPLFVLALTSAC